jgi:hypothetical protein
VECQSHGRGQSGAAAGRAGKRNFFYVPGVQAALGRTLEPADGLPGSPKVVVFTWALLAPALSWASRYG